MRVIDISQPVFSCEVYPGDPAPAAQPLLRMEQGAVYNLSAFSPQSFALRGPQSATSP